MDSRFVVASIPHTGTLTMEHFLTTLGVKHERLHFGQGLFSSGQQADPFKYIIPIRDPWKVYLTYFYRQQPLDQLERRWAQLSELAARDAAHAVHVDLPAVDGTWEALAGFLEVPSESFSNPQMNAFFDQTHLNHQDHPAGRVLDKPAWLVQVQRQWGYF